MLLRQTLATRSAWRAAFRTALSPSGPSDPIDADSPEARHGAGAGGCPAPALRPPAGRVRPDAGDIAETTVGIVGLFGFRKHPNHRDVLHHPDALVLEVLPDVLQHRLRLVVPGVSASVGAERNGRHTGDFGSRREELHSFPSSVPMQESQHRLGRQVLIDWSAEKDQVVVEVFDLQVLSNPKDGCRHPGLLQGIVNPAGRLFGVPVLGPIKDERLAFSHRCFSPAALQPRAAIPRTCGPAPGTQPPRRPTCGSSVRRPGRSPASTGQARVSHRISWRGRRGSPTAP